MSYLDPNYSKNYRLAHKDEINKRGRNYYHANKERIREKAKEYCRKNKEKIKARRAIYWKNHKELSSKNARNGAYRIKLQMIEAYGNKCACCSETRIPFLTLDHIGGGGSEHRKRCSPGAGIYRDVKRQGWPKDKYRLLCMNCNFATRAGRTCPHQTEKVLTMENN